jgi:restriction system protein
LARRKENILDLLVELPWWVSVALSLTVFVSLKYIIPLLQFESMIFRSFAKAAPAIATMLAFVLLVPAPVSAFNSWRKRKLLEKQKDVDTIRSLHWKEFEELVGEAYRRRGYAVTENMSDGPDGGIDLRLRKNGKLVLVQCKHWKAYKVDVKVVRELYGLIVAENASRGIVITSGKFTRPAKEFAEDKPVDLVEGDELFRMIREIQQNTGKKPSTGFQHPQKTENRPVQPDIRKQSGFTDINCPICGSGMQLRVAKKGPSAGQRFWGCSKFPQCRGTRSYN